jgi:hypothetical protein
MSELLLSDPDVALTETVLSSTVCCAALALKGFSDGYIRGITWFICKCDSTPVTQAVVMS